jgi:CDP-glucose 4,6-dehydratase
LAKRLWDEPAKNSGPWNFGPSPESACSVARVLHLMIRLWGSGQWKKAPSNSTVEPRETHCLRLCSDKAMSLLSWRPQWKIHAALRRTVEWYQAFYADRSARELRALCERQIDEYEVHGRRSISSRKPLESVETPV